MDDQHPSMGQVDRLDHGFMRLKFAQRVSWNVPLHRQDLKTLHEIPCKSSIALEYHPPLVLTDLISIYNEYIHIKSIVYP